MFNKFRKKIEDVFKNQSTGFVVGYATATVVACAVILNLKEEKDPYYNITKREFERAAEEGQALKIRNDLGHFTFYMDH